MESHPENEKLDVLNELAAGEDEFDVDLMATGCRLMPESNLALGVDDIVKLYDLQDKSLYAFIGALIDESKLESRKVFQIAEKAAKGDLAEFSRHMK